jgi:Icc protein
VITGDLTHDEQRETYEFLRRRLSRWIPKLRVLPGNHDDRRWMRAVFADRIEALGERIVFDDEIGGWRLIGLDSHVPGHLHGELGPEQLHWLGQELNSRSDLPTCLFLHHPPMRVGSAWLDQIGLKNAALLWELLREAPQVRAVCCGHVHQEFDEVIEGVAVWVTPSTGVQFRPATATLEVDSRPRGFRVLELFEDEALATRVLRVP